MEKKPTHAGGALHGYTHPPMWTHSDHIRALYLLIVLFLYIFLNLISETQFFSSSSKLFHKVTPLTDTHLPLMLTLGWACLKIAVPLRLYLHSLGWNRTGVGGCGPCTELLRCLNLLCRGILMCLILWKEDLLVLDSLNGLLF